MIVAGGGIAGLEALIGLRTLAGNRVEIELISPERFFAWRPLTAHAAFGGSSGPELEIPQLARAMGASCTIGELGSVDAEAGEITLADGERRAFDVLLVAAGARPEELISGAITVGLPRGTQRLHALLEEAESGSVSEIVFATSSTSVWPLAIYELAIMTAGRLRGVAGVSLTLLTPEPAPLSIFGGRASGALLEELEHHGIHFVGGVSAQEVVWGELVALPGMMHIQADAVVSLPRLRGPAIEACRPPRRASSRSTCTGWSAG